MVIQKKKLLTKPIFLKGGEQ